MATIVPGGTAYPMRSKDSLVLPFLLVVEGTTRSRRLGPAL